MKKKIFIWIWAVLIAVPFFAEDVVYLNTEQFRDRIFDYKTERERSASWHMSLESVQFPRCFISL